MTKSPLQNYSGLLVDDKLSWKDHMEGEKNHETFGIIKIVVHKQINPVF